MCRLTSINPVILAWEYPPRIIGDMAHHLESLTSGLSKAKIPVCVVTCHNSPYSHEKRSDLLDVYWASNPVEPHISIITWCLALNSEVERIVSDIFYERHGKIDLLDIHDWHFVSAGTSLKKALGIPFVFTLHSLEDQRSLDPLSPLSSCIRGLERMGVNESDLVITDSDSIKEEIMRIHEIPPDKIIVIPSSEPRWIREIIKSYSKTTSKPRRVRICSPPVF
jgi:glycosyltransferase involved in cell wall biosynthesis